ncbi:MAG TPA: FAD binding domain-containing protein [Polyangia bacterium]|jgi:probable selenate reductase FAD-binding subunit
MIQDIHHPRSVAEAVALRQGTPASCYYAGGTEINSRTWPWHATGEPTAAIMLDRLPLRRLEPTPAGFAIGAGITIQELVDGPGVPPLLAAAAREFANRNVRTMATLGGNAGSNGAWSSLAPALLCLDAQVSLCDAAGERTVAYASYVAQHDPRALITGFLVPAGWERRRGAARKHGRTATDVAIVSAAVSLAGDAARLERPLVAVNGAVPRATRLRALEDRLAGQPLPPRGEIDALVKAAVDPVTDLRGSAAFKRQLAAALVSDALRDALGHNR